MTDQPETTQLNKKVPSIVIVGSGFAGLNCARKLSRQDVQITLIDRRNFHLFQPLLYQVASGSLSPGDIASPVRTEFAGQENVTVIQAEVTGFDVNARKVKLATGDALEYDYLVVATGSHHHYFGNDQWADIAPGLKTIEDALEMRSRILHTFEVAEAQARSGDGNSIPLTFVIVGAGPTGVELAGTIGELAHATMKDEFRRINPATARIILVEGDSRVLPVYTPETSAKTLRYLEQLGVEIKLQTRVTNITPDSVELMCGDSREVIPTRTVLWAAGNKASALTGALAEQTGAGLDRSGRIMVDSRLNPAGHPAIFILGDMAHAAGKDGKPLPGVAPVAMQQGKYAARAISAAIHGAPVKPFKYLDKGSLAVVGRNRAVAEVAGLRMGGFFAWIMWVFIHIAYLIEFQNRVIVLFRWGVNYMSRKRGARLITGEGLEHPQTAEPSGVHPESHT